MYLDRGTKLGPYEILEPVGTGGMGEAYKARDTRLNRIVAIKISASQFTERFEREARAIAALNHPHICTLHDVGPDYVAMEFVEGPMLAERIAASPIPMEEDTPALFNDAAYHWDVAASGKRFLINAARPESGLAPITVVLNWTAGLKK